MSNIYIQEPPTNGKILMKTSLGEIDIELWSKEAPKACRNFVQLCMENYYDETIFHRVVKGFIAQGGDPTGTGTGGDSVYGEPFKDEFHQRLKFNRRGLVAMANAGADDNASQFFFTLDRTEELQKKHTIFGKVTGNTIYNMIRFNDLEVDHDDRPTSPPKVLKTEILSNPFDDIIPRSTKKTKDLKEKSEGKIKSKSKATKNYKLLSFGEEAEEEEQEDDQRKTDARIKSSHDVLEDKNLSSQPAVDKEEELKRKERDDADADSVRKKLKKEGTKDKDQETKQDSGDDEMDAEEKEKLKRRKALKEEARELMKSIKAKPVASIDDQADVKEKKKEKEPINDLMKQLTEEREIFKQNKKENKLLKKGADREAQTLALLAGFESEIVSLKDGETAVAEGDDDWMSHKLEFEENTLKGAKDANMKSDDWYDIYDPRNPMNKRRRDKKKDNKASSSKHPDI